MFPFLVVVFVTVVACQANLAVNQPVVCGPMPKEVYSCLGAPKVVKLEVARQCEKDLSELAKDYPEWEPAVQSAKAMCLTDDLPAQGIHLNCPAYDAMTCSFASFIKNTQPSQWSLLPECTSSRQFAAACPVCPSDCFAPVVPIGSCNACQSLQRSP
ncbi:uncharacterized protein LOC126772272 isoform X2 [Nymphalis io]|uniref:uncharacterized protein LOC126772272 isoform X2 n=1 Tax=Inachis io TaxID=171585 RepID=UPI00216AA2F7|nr:uncharacterized protein LOC126772272 isoform X2 [Nymphalis io]